MRRNKQQRKSNPSAIKIAAMILALIPVVALLAIITSLVLNSRTAIKTAGWGLLTATFNPAGDNTGCCRRCGGLFSWC